MILGILWILLVQGLSAASTLTEFEMHQNDVVVSLNAPGFYDIVNLTLPAECHVLEARMNISTSAVQFGDQNATVDISVLLNDTVLYSFNGTGIGGLGRQTTFSDGNDTAGFAFGPGGGATSTSIRLPKAATVVNATVNISATGPDWIHEKWRRNGTTEERFWILGRAGDVNNDGYDDFAVGAFTNETIGHYVGAAYLFTGGPQLDTVEDAVFFGNATHDYFGGTVNGVGDLNNDGYDDLAIDANCDDTGGFDGGALYVYYGGDPMDNISDIVILGNDTNQYTGGWIAGDVDLNGDGYDDLVTSTYPSNGDGNCVIWAFFGGETLNSTPDLVFSGVEPNTWFGGLPQLASDLNGDGCDDLVIGACYSNISGYYYGKAYVYFGGKEMDNVTDLVLTGKVANSHFGYYHSGLGDVNGDGFDDYIVGTIAGLTDPNITGAAYIFFGGKDMDAEPDIVLYGDSPTDYFGETLSSAGDVNADGYNDVIVGVYGDFTNGNWSGAAYIYYGGEDMDNISDMKIYGNAGEMSGFPVSPAGDLDGDGRDEVMVGAVQNETIDGCVRIYSVMSGLLNYSVKAGSRQISMYQGYYNGTNRTTDLSAAFNDCIKNASTSTNDSFGNSFVDIQINISTEGEGVLTLSNLSIDYSMSMQSKEFSAPLNKYILDHKQEKNEDGNITLPLIVRSKSPGQIMLTNLTVVIDEAPKFPNPLPDISMNEDTNAPDLIDIQKYFIDDYDTVEGLRYSVISYTNNTIVNVSVLDNRYLSIDAMNGTQNDNWTGTVDIIVSCSDRWNSTTISNKFTITVQNVPDPPVFVSTPPLNATAGVRYSYQAMAVDGDLDLLSFSLPLKQPDMTVDPVSGLVEWVPKAGGTYPVTLNVTDGQFSVSQNFSIIVPNQVPVILSLPNTTAITTVPYEYAVNASDPDGDPLDYSLVSEIPGMKIDSINGNISWIPQNAGDYSVKIKITDSKGGEAVQEFMIHVYEKVEPKMEFVSLPEKAKVEGSLEISGRVLNGSLNVVSVQYQLDSGEWVNLAGTDNWSLTLDTTKMKNGNHVLKVRVYDGQEFVEVTTRSFTVNNPVKSTNDLTTALVVVLIIGLAVAAGGLILWKGKKPPDEEE